MHRTSSIFSRNSQVDIRPKSRVECQPERVTQTPSSWQDIWDVLILGSCHGQGHCEIDSTPVGRGVSCLGDSACSAVCSFLLFLVFSTLRWGSTECSLR